MIVVSIKEDKNKTQEQGTRARPRNKEQEQETRNKSKTQKPPLFQPCSLYRRKEKHSGKTVALWLDRHVACFLFRYACR
jgi:hypothetical protein